MAKNQELLELVATLSCCRILCAAVVVIANSVFPKLPIVIMLNGTSDTKYNHHHHHHPSENGFDEEIIEEDVQEQKVVGKHDSGAADLAKVTDYGFFDEDSQQTGPSIAQLTNALSIVGATDAKQSKTNAELEAKMREYAKVVIVEEDVQQIMKEFDLSHEEAENSLRYSYGDVVGAMLSLVDN